MVRVRARRYQSAGKACLRLGAAAGERATIWDRVRRDLRGYFREQGLTAVKIGLDPALPRRHARSGKLRRILAFHPER